MLVFFFYGVLDVGDTGIIGVRTTFLGQVAYISSWVAYD